MAQRSPEMMRHVVFDHSAQLCDALDVVRVEVTRLSRLLDQVKEGRNAAHDRRIRAESELDAARATIRTLLDMAVMADVIDEGYAAEIRSLAGDGS